MLALKKTMTVSYMPANMYIFMSEVKQLNMQIYGAWLTVVSTTDWLNLSAQEFSLWLWLNNNNISCRLEYLPVDGGLFRMHVCRVAVLAMSLVALDSSW